MKQTIEQKQADQLYNLRERVLYWQMARQDAENMVKSLLREEQDLQRIMKG